jgi:hypothetical protein
LYLYAAFFKVSGKINHSLWILSEIFAEILLRDFYGIIGTYLALYEIYYAYCEGVFISLDSSNYLREAISIVNGYGFNYNELAGQESWFATWPIRYPGLIALVNRVAGHNAYFASKILSILLVFVGMFILYQHFKQKAWIIFLIYCNAGFLRIYKYTCSENPFILYLMLYTLVLSEIICSHNLRKRQYVYWGIFSCLTFLMRYFGIITVIITAFVIVVYLLLIWICKEFYAREIRGKIVGLITTDAASGILILAVFLLLTVSVLLMRVISCQLY